MVASLLDFSAREERIGNSTFASSSLADDGKGNVLLHKLGSFLNGVPPLPLVRMWHLLVDLQIIHVVDWGTTFPLIQHRIVVGA